MRKSSKPLRWINCGKEPRGRTYADKINASRAKYGLPPLEPTMSAEELAVRVRRGFYTGPM